MNVCFILVLTVVLQLLFNFLVKLLFPQLIGVEWAYCTRLILASFLSVFLPAYLYLKDEKKSYFTDCFDSVKPTLLIPVCIGIGICSQYVGILVNMPVRILIEFLGGDVSGSIPEIKSFSMFIFAVFSMCVIPAVFEEVMFRGVVLNYFRQFGKKSALIISSLLFAMLHCDFTNFFATLLIGVICGSVVLKTNRIAYAMIIHFMVNLTSLFSVYITNFEVANSFYSDCMSVFFLVSVPLLFYLLKVVSQRAEYLPYHDQLDYETIIEKIIPINEDSSIKIIEHDIRENNMGLALKKLYASPYFYILLGFFICLGGMDLW